MQTPLLTFTALLIGALPAPAQQVEAGILDSLVGPRQGRVRVIREGRTQALGRLAPVYAGDSVIATGEGMLGRIRLYGRAPVWVCARRAPASTCVTGLKVRAPARGGGLGAGIRTLVQSALAPLFGGSAWTRKVNAVARGDDDLFIPLLAAPQEIASGARVLAVSWRGGVGPFQLQVLKDGGGRVAGAQDLGVREARLGPVGLTPGEYALRIEDRQGTVRQSRFTVVLPESVPKAPPAFRQLGGAAQELLEAVWLAGRPEGRWSWEAYLRLEGQRGEESADRISAELAAGRLPPSIP
jgi:hypothetical protein